MSPNNDVSIEIVSFLATRFYNLDSLRFGKAPLDERKEGWTESWGGGASSNSNDSAGSIGDEISSSSTSSNHWNLDEEAVQTLLSTPYPQLPIILTQFRPAWLEQLVLRMANIPHIVLNSNSISNEATGPLPYLREHQPSKVPVLVGRRHPSSTNENANSDSSSDDNDGNDNNKALYSNFQNSILSYLSSTRNINLDSFLTDDRQRALSKCYITLIVNEIQPMINYLRYEDEDAWNQVYKKQYIDASVSSSNSWISQLKGRFQASMDRAVERRCLLEHSRRTNNIEEAVRRVKEALQSLESQLSSHDQPYLLGNKNPSLVDALAWSSLAECLCEIHLVVVVADFPRLITYFKHIHCEYFGVGNLKDDDWSKWNERQNKKNAFNQLPIDRTMTKKNGNSNKSFKDAIDLMQTLSLQNEEIQQVLNAAKSKRSREPWPDDSSSRNPKDSLMYRWRMGADLNKSRPGNKDTEPTDDNNPLRKKLMRDQIRNDQKWISGVVAVSTVAILLLQNSATNSSK